MKNKKNVKDIIWIIIGTVLTIVFIIIVVGGIVKKKSLYDNAECAKAVVIDHFFSIRKGKYFSYVFIINKTKYSGSAQYYKSYNIAVGDTINVIYDKTNPNNNMPEWDF